MRAPSHRARAASRCGMLQIVIKLQRKLLAFLQIHGLLTVVRPCPPPPGFIIQPHLNSSHPMAPLPHKICHFMARPEAPRRSADDPRMNGSPRRGFAQLPVSTTAPQPSGARQTAASCPQGEAGKAESTRVNQTKSDQIAPNFFPQSQQVQATCVVHVTRRTTTNSASPSASTHSNNLSSFGHFSSAGAHQAFDHHHRGKHAPSPAPAHKWREMKRALASMLL